MGFSRQTITRMFENEPGVIVIKKPTRMNKRRYRSIRIPTAVYERQFLRIAVFGENSSAPIGYQRKEILLGTDNDPR